VNKKCTKCRKTKSIKRFQKHPRYADGFHGWCKDCKNNSQKAHPDTIRRWVLKNKKRVNEIKRRYVIRNKEKVKLAKRKWHQSNPGKRMANVRMYQAKKLRATPPWLSSDHKKKMQEIYGNIPKGYEVDHIIPLRGKQVSGLHVPWNLQYLKASENRRKSNRA